MFCLCCGGGDSGGLDGGERDSVSRMRLETLSGFGRVGSDAADDVRALGFQLGGVALVRLLLALFPKDHTG